MLKRFYQKIHVAIIPEENGCDVMVAGVKNRKLLYKEHKYFDDPEPTTALFTYIRKFTELTPLYYISVLNPDSNQGAIEGCSLLDVNKEGAVSLCRNQKWMIYASVREIELLKNRYERVGVDFIFSPFSVIEQFFADKIGGDFALYALAQKDSFSVAFFEQGRLEFAHHFPMRPSRMTEEVPVSFDMDIMHEEEEHGIRLDDIESLDDLDIIDDLDDLSDIEDLDALEDIVEFSEDIQTSEEQPLHETNGKEMKEQMDRFNKDYRRFELIQKILSQFYAGEHCHNRFVEKVYIADAYGSGAELKRFLEEELFLTVMIRKIELGDVVIALSQIEEEGL